MPLSENTKEYIRFEREYHQDIKEQNEAWDSAMRELQDDRICRRLHDSGTKEVRALINLAHGKHIPRVTFK